MTERWFGPYRLGELIGRGGMGEVWRAVDTAHGNRVVAVKLLGAWLGGDDEFGRRFRREAELAAQLVSPHVVPIHGYGRIEGRHYIDMQYVEGVDLAALLAGPGLLPVERTCRILAQVAAALSTAHAAGLVHRDVKPSNVLVHTRGGTDHAYLIDFGIAQAVGATRISVTGAVIGTLAYMAPERFLGEGDHRADVYALGCVLHQALTGEKPFPQTNPMVLMNAHQNLHPPAPSTRRRGLDPALDAVVARAMAKDPDDRFADAAGFAHAVAAASGQRTAAGSVPTMTLTRPSAPDQPAGHSRRWVIATVGVAVAAVLGVGVGAVAAGVDLGDVVRAAPRLAPSTTVRPDLYRYDLHRAEVHAMTTAVVGGRAVVVSGALDGTIAVLDPATGEIVHELRASGGVDELAPGLLEGRPVAVSGGADRVLEVWDLESGSALRSITADEPVTGLAVTDLDGRSVVVARGPGTARVWDLGSGDPVGEPIGLAASPDTGLDVARLDGRAVLVHGENGALRLRDLRTGGVVGGTSGVLPGGIVDVDVVTMADGRPAAAVSTPNALALLDLATGDAVGAVPVPSWNPVHGTALLPETDGSTTVVVGGQQGPLVWNVAQTIVHDPSPVIGTGLTSIGAARIGTPPVTVFVAGSTDGGVYVWAT